QSDYFNYNRRTLGDFVRDSRRDGFRETLAERFAWAGMRMSAADLSDVSGATYTYLMNGSAPAGNWTGHFRTGSRVRPHGISASTFTYLMNGRAPAGNWTGLFRPGERVRLRFINASAMTVFDVRIPGLAMTVVAADGQYVHPVTVDELRMSVAETYDVIVEPA